MNLNNSKYYNKWFKNSWTYITGAILLAFFQIVTLAVTGEPWKISSAMPYWAAWLVENIGLDLSNWYYFNIDGRESVLKSGILMDPISIRNFGIIIGAFISSLLASQFRIRKIKSKNQFIFAAIGGFLMGYGARIALGCNIGGFFSNISSLSLSGWIFGFFIFIGAVIGSKIILKYLI